MATLHYAPIGHHEHGGWAIKIKTGTGPYRWCSGWDATYATRADAEAARRRANAQEGWTARVVELREERES